MKDLSKSEEQIMIAIWDLNGEVSMRMVHAHANEMFNRNWATQTVSTFMSRLCQKGYLNMEHRGRVSYYNPLIAKDEYRREKLHQILDDLYDGNKDLLRNDL